MASKKLVVAARKNIERAQEKWKSMTHRQRALAQPQGKYRKSPGELGEGKFYRVELRPSKNFVRFRNQDVGKKGGLERIAGKTAKGTWLTQAWLVEKKDAEIKNGFLVGKSKHARKLIETFQEKPKWIKGDIFKAKDRINIPEKEKPTPAMKKAQKENIKKAQAKRWA